MTEDEFMREYISLGHAIQSGVALEMHDTPQPTEPKHLRTGLNTVMCDHASLAGLLIKKGVITQDEYFAALLQGLRDEKARYEARLKERYGHGNITLG